MIKLSRSILSQARKVFSKGMGLSARSASQPVQFQADETGLSIRCVGPDVAIEHHVAGQHMSDSFAVPFDLLKRCEGKSDGLVNLSQDDDEITAEWTDGGIPQVARFALSEAKEFPPIPQSMTSNSTELLIALKDAFETADRDATRYALNCLQLRGGSNGHIAATDGRQLLVQRGLEFPWDGDVLVPACRVFAAADLRSDDTWEVGRSDDWVTLHSGCWTIHLRIEKEARFPDIESHLPNPSTAASALLISDSDAKFLANSVKRLPNSEEFSNPVTVDLNGEVAVRAQGEDQQSPTELILTGSRRDGQAVRFNTNREFLARAARLGFRRIDVFDAEKPVCCRDQNRIFVWALLTKDGAIQADPDSTRILSDATDSVTVATNNTSPRERTTPTTMKKPNANGNGRTNSGTAANEQQDTATILEQAETLKSSLQDALTQTRQLIASLKKQKKQTRLVQSTIASLRELQAVEV